MDRQNMLWPTAGTGERLAALLREAADAGMNGLSGSGDTIVVNYLDWVNAQVRLLQAVLAPHDLDRLLTTPRYWATFGNQIPAAATVSAVMEEVQHRATLLRSASSAVAGEVDAWRPKNGPFTNFVVLDTNVWINVDERQGLAACDWHGLVADGVGSSHLSMQDELRIVVPLLVVDELDGLSHRSDKRKLVTSVNRYLYDLLGNSPGLTQEIRPETPERGEVTIQLLFTPRDHTQAGRGDEEIVNQLVALRDFLGHPAKQVFFATYDRGAAFRATNAGLMTRLLSTPPR